MNNSTLFLIETLAPLVDKLKVKNPLIYTVLVTAMYGSWLYSNYLLQYGFQGSQAVMDWLKLVNYVMPLAMGAIQSRTTSHLPKEEPENEEKE